MGCLGRIGGCFGRTAMLAFAAIVVILVGAMIFAPDSDDTDFSTNPLEGTKRTEQSQSSVTPASWEIVETEESTPPNQRTRGELRIRMDANATEEAQALGIVEALEEGQRIFPQATVIIVFAYSTDQVDGPFDVGRAYSSRDGLGLNGAGDGIFGKDTEGKHNVQVGDNYFTFDKD